MNHRIVDLIEWLKNDHLLLEEKISVSKDDVIESLSDNSSSTLPRSVFFCKGKGFRKEYIDEAFEKGARIYITDNHELLHHSNYILVSDIRKAMAIVGSKFYDEPWKKLHLIGITGTKGKSTTAYMLKSILDDFLKNTDQLCGLMSSIENFDGHSTAESLLTTQEPLQLHKMLHDMVGNGCAYCVMEVSSQALKYDRIYGIRFDLGAFLNIGEDHISEIEHPSFEDYYQSKLRIFDYSNRVVVSDKLEIEHPKSIVFGKSDEALFHTKGTRSYQVNSSKDNTFEIKGIGEFAISIQGEFNILNAVAAAIIAKELDVPTEHIRNGLADVQVSGRMEFFESATTKNMAIVDYAHNKLSYSALFDTVKKRYGDYRIVTIFGCPGKKALKRRKELPQIAEIYSDYIFITEEDHGEEDIVKICREIYENIHDKSKAEIEYNRESAIRKAFLLYDEPILVLALGKGRETTQKRGREYVEVLSDVELVKKYIG